MHHFVLKCFEFFRSTMQFLKIICVMIILLILMYWIQNLIGAKWLWLSFIAPFIDGLLDISEKIYSGSFIFFGAVFEFKYAIAVILMIITAIILNLISNYSHEVQRIYHNSRLIFKKAGENVFNKNLQKSVEKQEKKLQKYYVTLKAKIKKKYSIEEFNVNIEDINNQINQFIITQLGVRPTDYTFSNVEGYYISEYKFEDFDNIDQTLDILHKVININNQVEYAICIQIDEDSDKLSKLVSLNHFGKITMAADTAYRYSYIESPRYKTSMTGLFQNGDDILEVHEFIQNL